MKRRTFHVLGLVLTASAGLSIDLYTFVLPHAAQWQTGDKVHYNQLGNAELGKKVATCIEKALANKTGAGSETRLVRPGFELVGQ